MAGGSGLVRPGIAAHAHAWGVHYGKQHLRLVTVVVLGVKLAIERVLPFVHAEGADPTCVVTANLTLPDRCLVLAQQAHTLAANAPLRSSNTRSFNSVEVPKS